jgi:hypothetical protein
MRREDESAEPVPTQETSDRVWVPTSFGPKRVPRDAVEAYRKAMLSSAGPGTREGACLAADSAPAVVGSGDQRQPSAPVRRASPCSPEVRPSALQSPTCTDIDSSYGSRASRTTAGEPSNSTPWD